MSDRSRPTGREDGGARRSVYHRATPQVRDFTDELSVAHMERLQIPIIASFDRDYDRFSQITRREP